MRTATIGGKKIEMRATPIALLYYKQEFSSDLIADMGSIQTMGQNLTDGYLGGFDSLVALQMAWAMNKASKPKGDHFPKFEEWFGVFEYIDYTDASWQTEIVEEVKDGFFRTASASGGNTGAK